MTLPKLNILISYPYMDSKILSILEKHGDNINFVMDSGAFTAFQTGKIINLDNYCEYLKELPIKPWRYFTLDVVGDGKKSYKNYIKMLEKGFTPVPIFTRGDNKEVLDNYYKTSDVVGLGGINGNPNQLEYVINSMKFIGNRRVHLLGFTRDKFLKYYRPYMCDSSSWMSGMRYGVLNLYMGNGKFISLNKKTLLKKPEEKIINRFKFYNIGLDKLKTNAKWKGGVTQNNVFDINLISWIHYSVDIYRTLGVNLFLALSSVGQLQAAVEQHNYLMQRGIL